MPMIWGGSRSAWDFGNPKNWVINKSLEQNVREFSTGTQIMGTVIPEAVAYKMAQQIVARGSMAAPGAIVGASRAAAGATGTAGILGASGAVTGASLMPLALPAMNMAWWLYLTQWLQKNWWIVAVLVGLYVAGGPATKALLKVK